MKTDRKEWDEGLLSTILHDHDVEMIMRLRLSDRIEDDFLAWHYEKFGIFSVRSACRLALKAQYLMNGQGSSTCHDGNRRLWNLIWSAPIPQKVKIFAWRLACDGLATQGNRKR